MLGDNLLGGALSYKGTVCGQKVLEKEIRRPRGVMLRAAAEAVICGATEHTPLEPKVVCALKIGDRIQWKCSRPSRASWMTFLHHLFCWGHSKCTSKRRDVDGGPSRDGGDMSSRISRSSSKQNRSSKGGNRAMLELAKKCPCN